MQNEFIGLRIRKLRKQKRLTQKELGEMIGCDGRTISLYERGKFNPASQTIISLADALEIATDDLLREISYPKKIPILDQDLLKLFIKIEKLPSKEKKTIKDMLKLLMPENKRSKSR